uniref:CYP68J5 n=1 Tax=Aspergillus ochraceus TaxID=40380 RepID=A0A7D5BU78_9EURO|nr:CYP68J5 [Aspergillus ochraceus]
MPFFTGLLAIYHSLILDNPVQTLSTIVVLAAAYWLATLQPSDLPELNPAKPFEFTNRRRVHEFVENSKSLLARGRELHGHEPYRLMSEWGSLIVLPPECADELRNDPRMDFETPTTDDSHGYIPGFDALNADPNLTKVVTKYLTKALNKLTAPISHEASIAMKAVLGDDPDWREIYPARDLLQLVARMSTRVFLGEEMCNNQDWIQTSSQYAALAFGVGDKLRIYPRMIRPIVHWFMPSCWELRRSLRRCRQILTPYIHKRKSLKGTTDEQGKPLMFDDSIEWFERELGPNHDAVLKQVTLSIVAIHTTSDLLLQAMSDLAQNPKVLQAVREEVVRVLSTEGLSKVSLHSLKLMDSALKESQRLRPTLLGSFRRQATNDIKLKSGFVIKKGTRVVIDSTHMWNPEYYTDPLQYDGYRYFNKRQTPGEDKNALLVSTSANHMGFGHGVHACPGRFFASNEIKIALCHIILNYEWRLPDGFKPQPLNIGMTYLADPNTRMLIRPRKAEIDMASLTV